MTASGANRFIITGAPGSGKTAIMQDLAAMGYAVVTEAATDVIARAQAQGDDQPWRGAEFVDRIVAVQRRRQETSAGSGSPAAQIYDRSPICTLALSRFLARPVTDLLAAEIDRVVRGGIYERRVFFVRPIGVVRATAARRITVEEALRFERLHEEAYHAHGYELVNIPSGEITDRAAEIDQHIRSWTAGAAGERRR